MQEDIHDTLLAQWLAGEIGDSEVVARIGQEDFDTMKRAVEEAQKMEAPSFDAESAFEALDLDSDEKDKSPVRQFRPRRIRMYGLLTAAAASVALLVIFLSGGGPAGRQIEHRTARAEKIKIDLPDGSEAELNADSYLAFKDNWEEARELELEGEAFFKVKKGSRFVVKTSTARVEVLGTSFNVRARDGGLRVECRTGRVRVSDTGGQELAVLDPGDFVSKSKGNATERGSFEPEQADWRSGYIAYKNEKFSQVVASMERQLDIELSYPDSLKDRRFNGSLKKDNPRLSYEAIAVLYGLQWKEEGNTKIIFY